MTMKISIFLAFVSAIVLMPKAVYAHCPLCTGAIGVMAVSASYYGVDSSIIGLFIGAFGLSTGLWVALKLKKRYIRFQSSLIVLASLLLTIIPLMSVGEGSITFSMLLF